MEQCWNFMVISNQCNKKYKGQQRTSVRASLISNLRAPLFVEVVIQIFGNYGHVKGLGVYWHCCLEYIVLIKDQSSSSLCKLDFKKLVS